MSKLMQISPETFCEFFVVSGTISNQSCSPISEERSQKGSSTWPLEEFSRGRCGGGVEGGKGGGREGRRGGGRRGGMEGVEGRAVWRRVGVGEEGGKDGRRDGWKVEENGRREAGKEKRKGEGRRKQGEGKGRGCLHVLIASRDDIPVFDRNF
jgi:hypothetical protein